MLEGSLEGRLGDADEGLGSNGCSTPHFSTVATGRIVACRLPVGMNWMEGWGRNRLVVAASVDGGRKVLEVTAYSQQAPGYVPLLVRRSEA